MKYLKIVIVNVFCFLLLISNAHSTYIKKVKTINHHIVKYYSNKFSYLNESYEGLVPDSRGKMQSLKDFNLHFAPFQKIFPFQITTVGVFDKFNKFDSSRVALGSGIAAENELFTAAHNFVMKKKRNYNDYDEELRIRPIDEILFGLTTEKFIPNDEIMFYEPGSFNKLKNTPLSFVYKRISMEKIDDIYIHPLYIVDKRIKNGLFYSDIDPRYDIARIKLKNYSSENLTFINVTKETPSDIEDIIIYQYPLGHPIQKSSIGKAYKKHPKLNIDYCHDSITLPASSGSGLINKKGEMIGVHTKGIFKRDNHDKIVLDNDNEPIYITNGYVPLRKQDIDGIDFSILRLK